jgi:hypothetical protein
MVIISRIMKLVGHAARMVKMWNSSRNLVKNFDGKALLRKHRRRWKDKIKMGLKEIMRTWTGFIWLRIVSSAGDL